MQRFLIGLIAFVAGIGITVGLYQNQYAESVKAAWQVDHTDISDEMIIVIETNLITGENRVFTKLFGGEDAGKD